MPRLFLGQQSRQNSLHHLGEPEVVKIVSGSATTLNHQKKQLGTTLC